MQCPLCRRVNPRGARFCTQCGASLPLSATSSLVPLAVFPPGVPESRTPFAPTITAFIPPHIATAPTVPAFTPPRARLRITAGRTTRHEVDCSRGTLTIGRAPESNLVVNDPRVSRQHAQIEADSNGWQIKDLGSHNGTFVNGKRVTSRPLHAGDKIVVGTTLLEFDVK